jgi:hypothetical protein
MKKHIQWLQRRWTVEPVDISCAEFGCLCGITTHLCPLDIFTSVLILQVCCALNTTLGMSGMFRWKHNPTCLEGTLIRWTLFHLVPCYWA